MFWLNDWLFYNAANGHGLLPAVEFKDFSGWAALQIYFIKRRSQHVAGWQQASM